MHCLPSRPAASPPLDLEHKSSDTLEYRSNLLSPAEHATPRRLMWIRVITFGIAMVFFLNPFAVLRTLDRAPEFVRWMHALAWSGLGIAACIHIRVHRRARSQFAVNHELFRRMLLWRIAIDSASICVGLSTVLYAVGITPAVAAFLASHIPAITGTVSNIVSTLIVWVLSGVVGNFAYDMLKKALTKRSNASKENPLQKPADGA
jgi:hypothetical protein